jgi:hypothetical protein
MRVALATMETQQAWAGGQVTFCARQAGERSRVERGAITLLLCADLSSDKQASSTPHTQTRGVIWKVTSYACVDNNWLLYAGMSAGTRDDYMPCST